MLKLMILFGLVVFVLAELHVEDVDWAQMAKQVSLVCLLFFVVLVVSSSSCCSCVAAVVVLISAVALPATLLIRMPL